MASRALGQEPQAGSLLLARVGEKGSRSHPFASSEALLNGPQAARALADLIHYLCAVHGRFPGMIEMAADRVLDGPGRSWLAEAADAFARERAFLARLSVAAGPVPATPGTGTETAIAAQRGALETLARSERRGCALGGALAVAIDWAAIRTALTAAAERFSTDIPPTPFPQAKALAELADRSCDAPHVQRALLFGAEQVALQHRAMWDLLAARAEARAAC